MAYFERYRSSGFIPHPELNFESEFNRLAQHKHWSPQAKKWRKHRRDALKAEFAHHFGSDQSDVENWKRMCMFLGEPVGSSVSECKTILEKVNVNIWDLIDEVRTGVKTTKFGSYDALKKYTKERQKYYPLEYTKEKGTKKGVDSYLKVLLKDFLKKGKAGPRAR